MAEIAVGDASVRIPVAGDVEGVEGVKAETHRLLTDYMKVLEGRHVDVEVSGSARVAIARRSKRVWRRRSKGAHTVVNTWGGAWNSRGIRSIPVINTAAHDLQRAILVGSRVTVAVGVISWTQNCFREAGVSYAGRRNPPPTDRLVNEPVDIGKIF